MKHIFILRHGQAHSKAPADELRELTDQGREDVKRVVADNINVSINDIFASPYVRAQQTAAIAKHALGFKSPIITSDDLTPDTDPKQALQLIAQQSNDYLLFVSHQPLVGDLVGLLIDGNIQAPIPIATAGLIYITFEDAVVSGCGKMIWMR